MDPAPQGRFEFAGFYRATVAPLRRYLTRLLGNRADAEDVAQDSYARVYPAMQAQRVEKPEAFLYTAARRLAFKNLTRRRTAATVSVEPAKLDQHAAVAAGVRDSVIARQDLEAFRVAVAGLPPRCREVFLLRKLELLPHEEIARRLGITVSTVDKQLARALRLVRAAMDDIAAGASAGPAADREAKS